ncbi:WAT1-related protein At5g40240-like [Humulus lupulus]|uniref:WAT1-related protein At5g40240-like n=1 Tax=Humulus lupulus TaxID=3486 RepID=UPI002B407B8A|nr:WAT1-related protein At5g40240-like [Humulus lupulus]
MENWVAFVGMVMAILAQASNMVVTKVAMSDGTNKYILALYSNAISAFILLPFAYLFHRSSHLPPLTSSIVCRFFFLALFGCSGQIFGYVGIDYSSPTLGTAMLNLIPAFTFILAIIFRMETIDWRSSSSQAKCLGTLVSIAGAFTVTLYKGPPIIQKLSLLPNLPIQLLFSSQSEWALGGLFLAADCFLSSLWYILQASTQRKYPAVLLAVLYQISFSALMAAVFSLIVVKDTSAWKLKLDMGLVAILYTAIVSIVIRYTLITWCVWKAGPLYCSMFKPLGIIFTVLLGAIFLGESLYLGCLVGAIIIVSGFYGVMWGKAKEEKMEKEGGGSGGVAEANPHGSELLFDHKVPLLQNLPQLTNKKLPL